MKVFINSIRKIKINLEKQEKEQEEKEFSPEKLRWKDYKFSRF